MCVCLSTCVRARVCKQVSEISPPKNLAIWSSTHIPRERKRARERLCEMVREKVKEKCLLLSVEAAGKTV